MKCDHWAERLAILLIDRSIVDQLRLQMANWSFLSQACFEKHLSLFTSVSHDNRVYQGRSDSPPSMIIRNTVQHVEQSAGCVIAILTLKSVKSRNSNLAFAHYFPRTNGAVRAMRTAPRDNHKSSSAKPPTSPPNTVNRLRLRSFHVNCVDLTKHKIEANIFLLCRFNIELVNPTQ